jgi:sarcosine/dimethylglycine N-methyltransferase
MRNFLTKAGFAETSWADKTDAAVAWLAAQEAVQRSASAASPLGIHVVMGSGFPEMVANFSRNLRENRARLIQAIVRRV